MKTFKDLKAGDYFYDLAHRFNGPPALFQNRIDRIIQGKPVFATTLLWTDQNNETGSTSFSEEEINKSVCGDSYIKHFTTLSDMLNFDIWNENV